MGKELKRQVEDMITFWKGLEQENGRSHKKEIEHCEEFLKEIENR